MCASNSSTIAALALAACLAVPLARAAGPVEVQWLQSDTYSDAGRSVTEREQVMRELGEFMTKLGRLLPDGLSLKLEITDLDLAGDLEPMRWRDQRILRGRADWPQMRLRYTLSADGRTLKSAEAQLSDMNYQSSILFGARQEALVYEKHMIEEWFRTEFAAP